MSELERWRPVFGYEGLYEVSNLGRVKYLERKVHFNIIARHLVRKGESPVVPRSMTVREHIVAPKPSCLGEYVVLIAEDGSRDKMWLENILEFAWPDREELKSL